MTPVELETMLHYFYNHEPHPRLDTPAYSNAVALLIKQGLLTPKILLSGDVYPHPDTENNRFSATEMGRIFVEALIATPLPTQTWEVRYDTA